MGISKRRLQLVLILVSLPILAIVLSRSYVLDRFRGDDPGAELKVDLSERSMSQIGRAHV